MPGPTQLVTVGGRTLRLSNLDKVLYPTTGTTKAEVLDYLTRIAPALLPHTAGRPVTRKRWPDGTGSESFFAKTLESSAPSWVPRHPIEHSGGPKDYPLVEEVATLVYLAQTASLELHVPQWRFDARGKPQNPDRLVLDLDPGPGVGLPECAEVARLARAVLVDLGMDPFPVTSGSKGIHLYAQLDGTRSSDEISAFAKELARLLEADHPDLIVSRMAKTLRPGRVLLDWSQNNAAKTTIAPYSLRGRDSPTVAAPRTWEELADPQLDHLLFDEALARYAQHGDLLAPLDRAAPKLGAYLAKRDAAKTPEPMPAASSTPGTPAADAGASPAAGDRFVIQEHHARRLHFDLRLERDGVLVSWAVPRGIPSSPDRNHLAVMTEPHPLEYLTFAGEIPRGEYGAGTMTIWDAGTFTLEKWRDDEVLFTATGRPGGPLGTARLALIRTAGSGEKSQWLLHRRKDATAHGLSAPAASAEPTPAPPPEPKLKSRAESPPIRLSHPAPMLATAATPAVAAAAAARWSAPWVEFKWDGIRAIGSWDADGLALRARSGTDITARYPELTALALPSGAEGAVVDGEIVALDAGGRPSFTRLQARMHLTRQSEIAREAERTPVVYMLFDALRIGDDDLTGRPLAERRVALERFAADLGDTARVIVPPVADDVEAALAAARELALEGVVVKNPDSRYRPGDRSDQWLKVKLTAMQSVVIGGVRPSRGGRTSGIASLLLGITTPEGLRYVGRVGTGFTERELLRLRDLLEALRSDEIPFVGVPAADAADAHWVRPELVAEVEYAEFTPGGTLRHARWRGLRPDLSPRDATPE